MSKEFEVSRKMYGNLLHEACSSEAEKVGLMVWLFEEPLELRGFYSALSVLQTCWDMVYSTWRQCTCLESTKDKRSDCWAVDADCAECSRQRTASGEKKEKVECVFSFLILWKSAQDINVHLSCKGVGMQSSILEMQSHHFHSIWCWEFWQQQGTKRTSKLEIKLLKSPFSRWYDVICRKLKNTTKKLLEFMN